jgi:cellulose synthase/poly-beta-1,6-N-acetylglucosamine synthase-like glycosyltransferase
MLFFEFLFWISLAIVIYSYFLYPLFLLVFARLFGRPANTGTDDYLPQIGVLIPAYNEEKVILRKIENILSMDYPADKLSVWVGSDCSNDRTDEIVQGIDNPRVHLWRSEQRGGKTGVINGLAPQITSEIIMFTDANTMHRKDCLRVLVKYFADKKVGGAAGYIEHKLSAGSENAETVYRKFESRQKLLEGQLHSSISAFGGFYAIRKELFRTIPQNAYVDDVLIPMNIIRQGYRVIYDPEAVSEEDMTEKVKSEFERRVRIGAGNFQSFFWLLDFFNPKFGWPWFCYISHKVTRWFSPFFILFCLVSCVVIVVLGGAQIYKFLLSCGIIFSVSGLLYHQVPLRINRHVFYFLAMNLALLFGAVRFSGGIKSAVWKRTER